MTYYPEKIDDSSEEFLGFDAMLSYEASVLLTKHTMPTKKCFENDSFLDEHELAMA